MLHDPTTDRPETIAPPTHPGWLRRSGLIPPWRLLAITGAAPLAALILLAGCAQSWQDDINAAFAALRDNRDQEAATLLEQAVRKKPDHAAAIGNLGIAYWRLDRKQNAADCFRKCADLCRTDPRPLQFLAILLREEGRYDDARAALREAMERDPSSPAVLTELAVLADARKMPDETLMYLSSALEKNPTFGPALYNSGMLLLREGGRQGEAERFLKEYLASASPDDQRAQRVKRMLTLAEERRTAPAQIPPEPVTPIFSGTNSPTSPPTPTPTATATPDAATPLSTAQPKNVKPTTTTNAPAPATTPHKPTPTPSPSPTPTPTPTPTATRAAVPSPTATSTNNPAAATSTNPPPAIVPPAQTNNTPPVRKTEPPKTKPTPQTNATSDSANESALTPTNTVPSPDKPQPGSEAAKTAAAKLWTEGLAFHKREQWDKAISLYKQALEQDPTMANASYNLGLLYRQTGRPLEAFEVFSNTIRLDPDMVMAHYMLGVTARDLKNLDTAESWLRKALSLDPDHGASNFVLGLVCHERNRPNEAVPFLQRYLRIDPSGPYAAQARDMLRAITEQQLQQKTPGPAEAR